MAKMIDPLMMFFLVVEISGLHQSEKRCSENFLKLSSVLNNLEEEN